MRLGWLINNFTDPHVRLTDEQRKAAERSVHEKQLKGKLLVYTLLVVVPPPLIAMWATGLADDWLGAQLGVSRSLANVLLIMVVVAATWPWSAWAYGRLYTRPYRRALREAGVRICEGCGYALGGLPDRTTCPECGEHEAG